MLTSATLDGGCDFSKIHSGVIRCYAVGSNILIYRRNREILPRSRVLCLYISLRDRWIVKLRLHNAHLFMAYDTQSPNSRSLQECFQIQPLAIYIWINLHSGCYGKWEYGRLISSRKLRKHQTKISSCSLRSPFLAPSKMYILNMTQYRTVEKADSLLL